VLPIFTDVVPSATDVFLYATNVSVATVVGHAFPRRSSRVQRVVSCSTHVSPCATHVSVATVVGHGFPRRCFPYVRTATDVLPIYTNVVPCATYVAPYLRMCFRMQRVDPCATHMCPSTGSTDVLPRATHVCVFCDDTISSLRAFVRSIKRKVPPSRHVEATVRSKEQYKQSTVATPSALP
jgi:hypothetical protein